MDGKKILLVEDDLFLRDLYVEVLKGEGFTVFTADDGEEGLRLGQDHPDASIMLLDIMLPKIHGVDVLKKLKGDQKTAVIPVALFKQIPRLLFPCNIFIILIVYKRQV